MQLGIRLHDVEKAPLERRLEIAKDQGFTCAHLALNKVISEFSTADPALTPGLAMYIKRAFEKNDLDVAVLGCYLNLATPDEEALAKNLHRYMAHIRFAALCGAGVVGTETGAVNTAYRFEEANRTEEALSLFIDRLGPVVDYAEKSGVILAIEPVARHIVCTPKRARKVLDEIHSPNLSIIFDPVNLLDEENYEQREAVFEEAMDLLGEDISVLHLKDFVLEEGRLKSVACGDGHMDYRAVLSFVKKNKPMMHATLENTIPANAQRAAALIRRLYDEAE